MKFNFSQLAALIFLMTAGLVSGILINNSDLTSSRLAVDFRHPLSLAMPGDSIEDYLCKEAEMAVATGDQALIAATERVLSIALSDAINELVKDYSGLGKSQDGASGEPVINDAQLADGAYEEDDDDRNISLGETAIGYKSADDDITYGSDPTYDTSWLDDFNEQQREAKKEAAKAALKAKEVELEAYLNEIAPPPTPPFHDFVSPPEDDIPPPPSGGSSSGGSGSGGFSTGSDALDNTINFFKNGATIEDCFGIKGLDVNIKPDPKYVRNPLKGEVGVGVIITIKF